MYKVIYGEEFKVARFSNLEEAQAFAAQEKTGLIVALGKPRRQSFGKFMAKRGTTA